MSITIPEGVSTLGNTKVKAVVSLADPTAPKLATELNAATSVDLSCFLYPEGWAPAPAQGKGQGKRRLCSKIVPEKLNAVTHSIAALQYVHLPQEADDAAGNEARELLVEGLKLWIVEFQGIDGQDGVVAVDDRSRAHHLELGAQFEMGDPADENGEFFIYQEVVYVNGSAPVPGVVAA